MYMRAVAADAQSCALDDAWLNFQRPKVQRDKNVSIDVGEGLVCLNFLFLLHLGFNFNFDANSSYSSSLMQSCPSFWIVVEVRTLSWAPGPMETQMMREAGFEVDCLATRWEWPQIPEILTTCPDDEVLKQFQETRGFELAHSDSLWYNQCETFWKIVIWNYRFVSFCIYSCGITRRSPITSMITWPQPGDGSATSLGENNGQCCPMAQMKMIPFYAETTRSFVQNTSQSKNTSVSGVYDFIVLFWGKKHEKTIQESWAKLLAQLWMISDLLGEVDETAVRGQLLATWTNCVKCFDLRKHKVGSSQELTFTELQKKNTRKN